MGTEVHVFNRLHELIIEKPLVGEEMESMGEYLGLISRYVCKG
jgi:hypothetical protein